MAGFAAVDAGLILKVKIRIGFQYESNVITTFFLKAFDQNANGILDGPELTVWRGAMESMFAEWHWQPSPEYIAGVEKAWKDSQMDGDESTGTQAELAQFGLRTWNLLLQ